MANELINGVFKFAEDVAQPVTDFYTMLRVKLIGKERKLKTVEGDGAESEEEYEFAEGLTVVKEGASLVNRKAANTWSNMNELESDNYENVNSVVVSTANEADVIDLEATKAASDEEANELADTIMSQYEALPDD